MLMLGPAAESAPLVVELRGMLDAAEGAALVVEALDEALWGVWAAQQMRVVLLRGAGGEEGEEEDVAAEGDGE